MRSSVVFAIVALVAKICCGQKDYESKCPGGICVPKAFCPNGTYIPDATYTKQNPLVGLHINEIDECSDYLMMCCKTALAADYSWSHEKPDLSEPYGATCGQTNENGLFYKFHSNETLAQYGEFPWVVYIFTRNEFTSSGTLVCGGTLINRFHVLTTAHNVDKKSNLIARFGEWDIGTDNEPLHHQDIRVYHIRIHPSYVHNPIQGDLAILVLEKKVEYRQHIQPICLPKPDDIFDGQRCISNGWGTVQGTYAKVMKKLILPVIPRAKCQTMLQLGGLGPSFRLREGFMCAGGEGIVDTCKGDGGSPLACQQQDGNFVLAGIVSWGIGCGVPNIPGAYVATNNYVAWINDQIYNHELNVSVYVK